MRTFITIIITLCTMSASAQERDLSVLRNEIDSLDDALINLLDQRMKVCREVGLYKQTHDMPVLQSDRFSQILEKRSKQGVERGMDADFIRKVFNNIHDESCRQQDVLMRQSHK